MNVRVALRWVGRSSISPTNLTPLSSIPIILQQQQQIRHKSGGWLGLGGSKDKGEPPETEATPTKKEPPLADLGVKQGDLAENTLFNDELTEEGPPVIPIVDPLLRDPKRDKWTWLKRADAREHRRRGRLTKKEKIMRTEKEHVAKSHFIKTSLKKLGPIARQIAGKNLEYAITQMRFSPKKAARDVLGHLNQAKNEAFLRKRMHPMFTYIEQAWVGRGKYDQESSHRAKGRIDRLRLPYTSITVVLKEENTRKRIMKEKEEKLLRKKPWVQLPNRPIYGQTQYYRW